MLSVVGFGGIIVMDESPEFAANAVSEAVDLGVNYFDIAPAYGNAIDRLGPALESYRDGVFLACKTIQRDAKGAREEIDACLKTMRTDRFDLFQLHAITDVEKDVEAVFAPGGAMEALIEAREAGRIRYLGFSAHSTEAAERAMTLFDFDSVLFPVNYTLHAKVDFGPRVLQLAEERGMARLALKAMARGLWEEGDPKRESFPKMWYEPLQDDRALELSLRYTLSQGVTAALPPGDLGYFRKAVEIARQYRPLEPAELDELDSLVGSPTPLFASAEAS